MSQKTKLMVLIVLVMVLIVVTLMTVFRPPRKVVRVRQSAALPTRTDARTDTGPASHGA